MSTAANSHWTAKRNQEWRNARTHFGLTVCLWVAIGIAQSQLNIGSDFNVTEAPIGFGSSCSVHAPTIWPANWRRVGENENERRQREVRRTQSTYICLSHRHCLVPSRSLQQSAHWCFSLSASVAGVLFICTEMWSVQLVRRRQQNADISVRLPSNAEAKWWS